jgi:hypothetical protein
MAARRADLTEPGQKLSSAEIVAEISRTRARLSRRLAVLDREYALRHVVVRTARFVRHADSNAAPISETLGRDAVPLTLIAIGLGWLGLAGGNADGGVLQRLASGIAALERVARDFGFLPARVQLASPPPAVDGTTVDPTR